MKNYWDVPKSIKYQLYSFFIYRETQWKCWSLVPNQQNNHFHEKSIWFWLFCNYYLLVITNYLLLITKLILFQSFRLKHFTTLQKLQNNIKNSLVCFLAMFYQNVKKFVTYSIKKNNIILSYLLCRVQTNISFCFASVYRNNLDCFVHVGISWVYVLFCFFGQCGPSI